MQKNIIILLTLLILIATPNAYAQTPYIVLTPGAGNSSFSAGFNQTANLINTSLANNSAIVYFDDTDTASYNTTIASHSPDYVFLVIQPQYATPQLLDEVGDMLKTLDSDPFVDVAWGVITGSTNTSAWNLYGRTIGWTEDQYAVSNAYQSCAANADNVFSRFTGNPTYNYNYLKPGSEPTATNIQTAFDSPQSLFYFCTNIVDYNIYSMYNTSNCFDSNENASSVICNSTAIGSAQDTLFLSDTSESGRVSGTVTSPWMQGNNTNALNSVSFPVSIISNEHAGAVVAPYSTRWPTAEFITKNILTHATSGSTLGNSVLIAKNTLLLNIEKESIENKSFAEHIEKEYILYGKPNHAGTTLDNPYTSSITNEILSGAIHTIGKTLLWNATLEITPTASKYNKIYSTNVWNNVSLGSVWYKNITSMDANNTVNITFTAAVTGKAYLHDSLTALIISEPTNEENITKIMISANNTTTAYASNTTELMNTTIVMKDNTTIYFAILYSPTESITSGTREVNITFNTTGISKNITSTAYTLNNATIYLDFKNPTAWIVTNVTAEHILPRNITTTCTISGINCAIVDNGTDTKAIFNISTLLAGTTNHNIVYATTLSATASVTNPEGAIHDRGDTLEYTANITSINETFADIEVTLYNPGNAVVWLKNDTTNVSINSSTYNYSTNWLIPNNATVGEYSIKLIVKENSSGITIYEKHVDFEVTDQLFFYDGNGTIDEVTLIWNTNPDAVDWNYFTTTDVINISGTVKDQNNNSVGSAVVDANLTNGGTFETNTTNVSGVYEIGFSWSGETPGTKTLSIVATDINNNTATYTQTIYISNYANKTTFTIAGHTNNIYEYNKENVTITVTVLDASGNKVYLGDVTLTGSAGTKTDTTDTNGVAAFIFPAPEDYTLDFAITASSPLNTSTAAKITNSSSGTYYSTWIYYESMNVTPTSPKIGQDITLSGEVYFKGNKSSCTSGTVNIKVYKGAYSRNKTVTVTDNAFSHEFDYTSSNSDEDDVNFQTGTWYYALDGSLSDCKLHNRTFTTITADVQPSDKSFSVASNVTTTTSGSDDDDSTSDTTSSSNEETCTQNSDCSSGDYCSNSVCAAISCDDGVIVDHQCISAYKIDINENPDPFFVEQGTSKSFEFTVKNTGYKNLTNITASIIAPETITWESWYSMTELKSNLAVNEQNKSTVQINVPETESIKVHTIKIKIVSTEKTQEKNMTLQIIPGEKEQRLINSSLNMLTTEIIDTEKDIETLMKKLSNPNTTTAKTKLDTVKKLHAEALEAISTGDYLTAYNKKQEINSLMQDIRAIVTDGQASIAKSSSLIRTVFLALFSIVAIGAVVYYLWVPAPNEYAKNGNYGRIPKKSTNPFIAKIKAQVDSVVNEYKKQKETEANAPQKYNFHKKKRWSK